MSLIAEDGMMKGKVTKPIIKDREIVRAISFFDSH